MAENPLEGLADAVLAPDKDATLQRVRSILDRRGAAGARQAVEAIAGALQLVGKRFQEGEWFLPELVYAGEVARAAIDLLTPQLADKTSANAGTVILGTVAGDLHDLGKNIFSTYARGAGFEVLDLGVDVTTEAFVGAVEENQPRALGISCLLTITAGGVGGIIQELERQGLRQRVKVLVGGAAMTEEFAREVGADAFAPDAVTGTDIVRSWSVT